MVNTMKGKLLLTFPYIFSSSTPNPSRGAESVVLSYMKSKRSAGFHGGPGGRSPLGKATQAKRELALATKLEKRRFSAILCPSVTNCKNHETKKCPVKTGQEMRSINRQIKRSQVII